VADLRDYLAEERTFLAWIRTGIALMAFGFVLAHFGIFADEPHLTQRASGVEPHELSLWFGAALIAVGVTVNLSSAWRYMPIEPGSIRAPLRLEARRGPGHVPGAARDAHGDLHGSGAAAAAGNAACAIGAHVRIHRRP
jgi:uncharacterized protein DUF202